MNEPRKEPLKSIHPRAVVHLAKSLGSNGAAAMCGVFDLPAKAVTTSRAKVTCEHCAEAAKRLMAGKAPANIN